MGLFDFYTLLPAWSQKWLASVDHKLDLENQFRFHYSRLLVRLACSLCHFKQIDLVGKSFHSCLLNLRMKTIGRNIELELGHCT